MTTERRESGTDRLGRATAAMVCLLGASVALAQAPLTDVVPDEALAAYFSTGPKSGEQSSRFTSTVGVITFLAGRAQEMGLLSTVDDCSRMWIDSFASIATVLDHPFAIALLDVDAKPRADGGYELADLGAMLACRTAGSNQQIERRIQHVLSTYTNNDDTKLSSREGDGRSVFTLHDHRLPPWSSIRWGAVGDYYVVTVGEGTFERVAAAITDKARSLADDEWFRGAFARAGGGEAAVSGYLRFDGLTGRADTAFGPKVAGVQEALGMSGVGRAFWTARFDDRAVEVTSVRQRGGDNEVAHLASRRFLETVDKRIIPDEATGYAVIDCNPRRTVKGISEAYLATRSAQSRAATEALWNRLAEGAGVSIDADIMSLLGSPVVIHNHPKDALGLPLAWTILVRVSGDPALLKARIDRWLTNAQKALPPENLFQVRHDDDGVWYIQYGLMGPGLKVTDKWLVFSFSPQAVRQNVELLTQKAQPVAQTPAAADR